jgi:hypothetical protein
MTNTTSSAIRTSRPSTRIRPTRFTFRAQFNIYGRGFIGKGLNLKLSAPKTSSVDNESQTTFGQISKAEAAVFIGSNWLPLCVWTGNQCHRCPDDHFSSFKLGDTSLDHCALWSLRYIRRKPWGTTPIFTVQNKFNYPEVFETIENHKLHEMSMIKSIDTH